MDQGRFQQELNRKLSEIKLQNPSYSVRAFARKLDVNSGALSSILNGKRRVSTKLASRIADRMGLDPKEKAKILNGGALPEGKGKTRDKAALEYESLSVDQFRVISDWYHFGILSLAKVPGFRADAEWLAARMGIARREARGALQRLIRLGYLKETESGSIVRSKPRYKTTDEIVSLPLRRAHFNNLELAKRSLEKDPIEERDFTSITLAIDPSRLPKAKEKIRKFQDELAAFLEGGKPREVYKMCVQVFPITIKEGSLQ